MKVGIVSIDAGPETREFARAWLVITLIGLVMAAVLQGAEGRKVSEANCTAVAQVSAAQAYCLTQQNFAQDAVQLNSTHVAVYASRFDARCFR